MTTTDDLTAVFVDTGLTCAENGVLPQAGRNLADRLIAEGHADILAQLVAEFWMANASRLARRDRWAAATKVRAGLDPGEMEPPAPPTKPADPPPTEPAPPTDPPTDRGGS